MAIVGVVSVGACRITAIVAKCGCVNKRVHIVDPPALSSSFTHSKSFIRFENSKPLGPCEQHEAKLAMAKGSSIQALYELCRKTFTPSAASASPHAIRKLAALMDTITPAEVGLEDVLEYDRGHGFFGSSFSMNSIRTARWAQPISYLHVYECDNFTIGIFCLPTSSVIPLHDHPGMTVLSKILYGSMHVKAYDWLEPSCTARSGKPEDIPMRLAKLQTDTVLTAPCPTTVLYPKTGGNLHCFTAVMPCAVLDVLAPPYSEVAGRHCTYYHDYPYSSFTNDDGSMEHDKGEDYAWLKAINAPDDLYMRSGTYTGPAVQDHAL